jgi:hypothetical protein
MKPSLIYLVGLALVISCKRGDPAQVVSASFTLPTTPQATEALQLHNTSQNAVKYAWSFGDGTTDKMANPMHTYAKAGTYQITLRAYGTHQDSASTTQSLLVGRYDVFSHTAARIAGTYDCKVDSTYTESLPTPGPITKIVSLLKDRVLTIDKIGSDSVRIKSPYIYTGSVKGQYMPTMLLTSLPYTRIPGETGYPFSFMYGSYVAYFYASGDSLIFRTAQPVTSGRTTATVLYRGRRRP